MNCTVERYDDRDTAFRRVRQWYRTRVYAPWSNVFIEILATFSPHDFLPQKAVCVPWSHEPSTTKEEGLDNVHCVILLNGYLKPIYLRVREDLWRHPTSCVQRI